MVSRILQHQCIRDMSFDADRAKNDLLKQYVKEEEWNASVCTRSETLLFARSKKETHGVLVFFNEITKQRNTTDYTVRLNC